MDLASIRIITHDVDRLSRFYEAVTGAVAVRPAPVFAELRTATEGLGDHEHINRRDTWRPRTKAR